MSSITPVRYRAKVAARFREIIVPADVASVAFDYGTTPATVLALVDNYVLADANAVHAPGGQIERFSAPRGSRAIHLAFDTSASLSAAPAAVAALVAGLASAPNESYVIWSQFGGDCWLVARRAEGLRHAVFDFLYRAGVRYYGPHPAWKVTPARGFVDFAASELVQPLIRDFFYAGNGGPGGGNTTVAGAQLTRQTLTYQRWADLVAQQRNPREWGGAGSDGGETLTYYKQTELSADNRMRAWDAGNNHRGSWDIFGFHQFQTVCQPISFATGTKLCCTDHRTSGAAYPARPGTATPWVGYVQTGPITPVGSALPGDANPESATPHPTDYVSWDGLIKLHGEHARDAVSQRIALYGAGSPQGRFAGTSPNDGANYCQCSNCRDLLRNGPYGAYLSSSQKTQDATPSDFYMHLHNTAAWFLGYWFATAPAAVRPFCLFTAYSEHLPPPSIPIAINSGIYFLTGSGDVGPGDTTALSTAYSVTELEEQWSAKRATNPYGAWDVLGISPTWLISNTNFDRPSMSPRRAISKFKRYIDLGYNGFLSQSTYSNMAAGCLFYVLGRLCYDRNLDTEAAIAEWFTPFGAAATQVKATFERWWQWFEFTPHEIGQSYRDCQAAQTALTADPNKTAAQQAALDHFRAYVHWLRLRAEHTFAVKAHSTTPNPTTLAALDAAADAALDWAWNVHSMAIIQAERQATVVRADIPGSETTLRAKWDPASGASAIQSAAEPTTSALTTLVASGVTAYPPLSGVTRASFGTDLVRWTTTADTTLINFPECDQLQSYTFIKGAADVTFNMYQLGLTSTLTRQASRIRVLDLAGNLLQVFSQAAVTSVITVTPKTITLPAGTYQLIVDNNGINTNQLHLQWPRNVPIGIRLPQVAREFAQSPYPVIPQWFYVPLGTTRISLAFNSVAAPQFYRPDGVTAQTTVAEGMYGYYCDVPGGLDGQPWSFANIQTAGFGSYPWLENCVNVFSFDKSQVLVPRGLDGF